MTDGMAVNGFDYAQIPPGLADEARLIATRIKSRLTQGYIETGHDLLTMKLRLGHGMFGKWLAAEFQMTVRTAENYMNAADFLQGKNATISFLPPAVIYALAAPSAPADVVHEVVAAAKAGAMLAPQAIREKLANAKDAERKIKIAAKKTPEQVAKEQRRRAANDTRTRKLQEEVAAKAAEQDTIAREAAYRLASWLEHGRLLEFLELVSKTHWSEVEMQFRAPFRDGAKRFLTALEISRKFDLSAGWFGTDDASIKQEIVDGLHSVLDDQIRGIEQVPQFLRAALDERVWEGPRSLGGGRTLTPMSFRDFLKTNYPVGLGIKVERLRELLSPHPELQKRVTDLMQ